MRQKLDLAEKSQRTTVPHFLCLLFLFAWSSQPLPGQEAEARSAARLFESLKGPPGVAAEALRVVEDLEPSDPHHGELLTRVLLAAERGDVSLGGIEVATALLDPDLAPALFGILESIVRETSSPLSFPAAEALIRFGCASPIVDFSDLRPEPESALALYLSHLQEAPVALERCDPSVLRLLATRRAERGWLAYLTTTRGGPVWEVTVEDRVLGGSVQEITATSVGFSGERVVGGFKREPYREALRFAELPLERVEGGEGEPMNFGFVGTLPTLVSLFGHIDLPLLVDAGVTAEIRFAARSVPWDAAIETALTQAGLKAHTEESGGRLLLRVMEREATPGPRPALSPAPWTDAPIEVRVVEAEPRELLVALADRFGLAVDLPDAKGDRVTADAAVSAGLFMESFAASRGWGLVLDGGRLVFSEPGN